MFGPLFAAARGYPYYSGDFRCFYCGSQCGPQFSSAHFVKDSFTSRDTVCGGDYVCGGCVAALDERATITLPDGAVRESQKTRCYSWIVANGKATAATKAHREWLLSVCLNPPAPPSIVCLSDSGQRHLLYRSVVNYSQERIVATLEADRVAFTPPELATRLVLCKRVAAALGQPALSESLSPSAQVRLIEHHDDETVLTDWLAVREQPLTRLAAWFCPPKKECEREYPCATTVR